MTDADRLQALVTRLQRREHERAIGSHPLFSVEHWKHHAGEAWPHEPDDDSYLAFENCEHPDCVLARSAAVVALAAGVPPLPAPAPPTP